MEDRKQDLVSRRQLLTAASAGAAGLGLFPWSDKLLGAVGTTHRRPDEREARSQSTYVPPPEKDGGWRVTDPSELGVDAALLRDAITYHDRNIMTTSLFMLPALFELGKNKVAIISNPDVDDG